MCEKALSCTSNCFLQKPELQLLDLNEQPTGVSRDAHLHVCGYLQPGLLYI